jgi:hypothetical protein
MHSAHGVNVYSSEFLQALQHTHPPINRLMRRRLSHSTFMYPPVKPNTTLIPPTHPTHPTHTTKVPLTTLIAYKKLEAIWSNPSQVYLPINSKETQKGKFYRQETIFPGCVLKVYHSSLLLANYQKVEWESNKTNGPHPHVLSR